MATLHIVCQADALHRCIEVAGLKDTVLLTGSALQHAGSGDAHPRLIVLAEGLTRTQMQDLNASGTQTTDYDGFVRLVAAHQPIVSWS